MIELAERALPVLGFLLAMTIIAELAERCGLFALIADRLGRWSRGSVPVLWAGLVVVALAATIFLSLDTTAVLLTPVVLALAQRMSVDPRLFAYTCVWLANTGSLLLPVSNLTNLLSLSTTNSSTLDFLSRIWPAALTAAVITVGVLAIMFRRTLAVRGVVDDRPVEPANRGVLIGQAMIIIALAVAIVVGAEITLASLIAAALSIILTAIVDRSLLRRLPLPWRMMLGVGLLLVVVEIARQLVLDAWFARFELPDSLSGSLLLAGLGAGLSNLINNLPAYLTLEPLAQTPALSASLLVGVNAGPLITPWASLATLLWAGRCRAAGVRIGWGDFALRGLLLTALVVPSATASLVLTG